MTDLRTRPADVFLRGFGTADGIEWGLWLAATVYWITIVGLSEPELALLGIVLEVTVILSETPTGVIADVRSRRQSLIVAQVLMGLSFAWTFASGDLLMLLASHALLGFGWTFRSGADVAWITDELSGGDETVDDTVIERLLLRRTRLGMIISLIVGPLTIAIGWFWSVRAVGLLLSFAYIAIAIWMAFAMTEDHFTPGSERGAGFVTTLREGIDVVRTRPRLRTLILIAALFFTASELFGRIGFFYLLETADLRSLDGSGESLVITGVLFFVSALGGIAINRGAERALEGGGEIARIAGAMLILAALGGLLVATSSVVVVIGIGLLLHVSVEEAMYPLMDGWVNGDAPSEVRATVHSLIGQTVSISQIGGVIVLVAVAEAASVPFAFGVATALIALSAVIALGSKQREPVSS